MKKKNEFSSGSSNTYRKGGYVRVCEYRSSTVRDRRSRNVKKHIFRPRDYTQSGRRKPVFVVEGTSAVSKKFPKSGVDALNNDNNNDNNHRDRRRWTAKPESLRCFISCESESRSSRDGVRYIVPPEVERAISSRSLPSSPSPDRRTPQTFGSNLASIGTHARGLNARESVRCVFTRERVRGRTRHPSHVSSDVSWRAFIRPSRRRAQPYTTGGSATGTLTNELAVRIIRVLLPIPRMTIYHVSCVIVSPTFDFSSIRFSLIVKSLIEIITPSVVDVTMTVFSTYRNEL